MFSDRSAKNEKDHVGSGIGHRRFDRKSLAADVATKDMMKEPMNYKVDDWDIMLSTPSKQPSYAKNICTYQGAELIQLDKNTLFYVVSIHEVGGGDHCVGNHGFIIKSAKDLKRATLEKQMPIEVNGPQTCKLPDGGDGELIKFLVFGGMVPLDAVDAKGKLLPAAGKGRTLAFQVRTARPSVSRVVVPLEDLNRRRVLLLRVTQWKAWFVWVCNKQSVEALPSDPRTGRSEAHR